VKTKLHRSLFKEMAAEYIAASTKTFQAVKQILGEKEGWNKIYEGEDTIVTDKKSSECPINCVKAWGLVNGSAKDLCEKVWSWKYEDHLKLDSNLLKWEIVEQLNENHRILYQVNKLVFPLYSRDMSVVQSKYEENGSYYVILKSINHPKTPEDPKNFVRANIIISAYCFEPQESGKTLVSRVVLVDPCGNIPTMFVNAQAKGCNVVILHLRK